jgi:nicotinamide-nucleotide amidase
MIASKLGPAVFASTHHDLPRALVERLTSRGQTITSAESCTGGLLAGAITAVPGSSACFHAGWVCYSNAIKSAQLGVPEALFASVGAVSREVAGAMARGALERSGAHWALSVTGIAGPDGGTATKPVGTVYIGLASRAGALDVRRFAMIGSREDVRAWSVTAALAMLHLHTAGAPEMKLLRQTQD